MKRFLFVLAIAVVVLAGLVLAVLQSSWLRIRVAERVRLEIERATGARAEIGRLSIDWSGLRFSTGPIVVHGTEPADAPALFAALDITVDLKLVSYFRREIDVESILIDRPRVHVLVRADGTTNVPGQGGGQPLPERLIDLAANDIDVREGEITVNDRHTPFQGRAEGVRLLVGFDKAARLYRGKLAVRAARLQDIELAGDTAFELTTKELAIRTASLRSGKSTAEVQGTVSDWVSPKVALEFTAKLDAAEAARWIQLPGVRKGLLEGSGRIDYDAAKDWRSQGRAAFRGLDAELGGERLSEINGTSKFAWAGDRLRIDEIDAKVWRGRFNGALEWATSGDYSLSGRAIGVRVPREIASAATGPVKIAGRGVQLRIAEADLELTPVEGHVPVGGTFSVAYNGTRRTAEIRPSSLTLGQSRVNLAGSIENGIQLELRTRDIGELLPALRLFAPDVRDEVPVNLDGGLAIVRGAIHGPWERPSFRGTAALEKATYGGYRFADVRLNGSLGESLLSLERLQARYGETEIDGTASVGLSEWKLLGTSPVNARLDVGNAHLTTVLRNTRWRDRATGLGAGKLAIGGTVDAPTVAGPVRVANLRIDGLAFDSGAADVSWRNEELVLKAGELRDGRGSVKFAGSYRSAGSAFALDASSPGWSIPVWGGLRSGAKLAGNLRVNGSLRDGRIVVASLTGDLVATANSSGTARVKAETTGGEVSLTGDASLFGATATFASRWKLEPGLPGGGEMQLRGVTPVVLQKLWGEEKSSELPFTGSMEGGVRFEGRLLEPDRLAGRASLTTVRFAPKRESLTPGLTVADLTVRNDGDVTLDFGTGGIVVERARFVAKDTGIEGIGNVSFRRANAWNLLLRGRLNLAVLGTFRPDLVSSGVSTLNARIRGSLDAPQLDGRLQLANAAFSLRNVPNGLDKVNGTVLFDQRRATIDSLTAETGGGTIRMGGFVGFGEELSYQLQAQAERVRVRYPEGVSTQGNAQLTLTGTSRRSLLAGTVTILRASLGGSETAGLLTKSAMFGGTDVSNDFLRGLQFDVRVETSQSAELATQLTRDVQADIDLRLRGTAARPVLLGRLSVTQGQVQFFGTDYTINRGEVSFVNPVRIDPQLDLDLETRVRGIAVSINFAGPLNKMNMTYRSDPPLQSSEILALLAVGRTPTTATQAGLGAIRGQDLLGAGGNAILSSAMSAPSNSGLQRFFGISRIKIDPQLIGLDNTPQARLSVEQPISRDVSVTYITSLNRAQNQLVRVQWDLSREWSAIATRDENGVLSVDFVFKRSFK